MNHALKAAIALVMGVGLAASAQAHGTFMHRTSAMHGASDMHRASAMSQRPTRMGLLRQRIKTAQRQLKADGLYKGKIDGKFSPATRMAVARFQQRNGLQRTATLNRETFNRLTGNQAIGVGSSMPKKAPSMTNNGNGNGSSTAATPMVPPATNSSNAGAGNNQTPTTDSNAKKY